MAGAAAMLRFLTETVHNEDDGKSFFKGCVCCKAIESTTVEPTARVKRLKLCGYVS
jgi:hypothetical protein